MANYLDIPKVERCAFCDYLSEKRPFTVLYRNAQAAVLVTREQRGASHVLVVPVRHVPSILDLRTEESHRVMDLVQAVAVAIDRLEQRPGISVWQNNGKPSSQAIPHVHFHVAGTLENGGTEWDEVPELSLSQTDAIASRLRPHLLHALGGVEE